MAAGTHADWYVPKPCPAYGIDYILRFLGEDDDQRESIEEGVKLLTSRVILRIPWYNDTSGQFGFFIMMLNTFLPTYNGVILTAYSFKRNTYFHIRTKIRIFST
ncbi:hypothetical protein SDC9_164811 [bioreactor metagenome]|uniref:Uncharacterized protein n=1 Tax=bioreactor metagenome TaxID=1076179 RepID=A0A645FSM2_9ZZZZ